MLVGQKIKNNIENISIRLSGLLQGDWCYKKKLGQTIKAKSKQDNCDGVGIGFYKVIRISPMEKFMSQ